MLVKILNLLILTVILSGCGTTNYSPKEFKIALPEMPIAGKVVAAELEELRTPKICENFNDWSNKLFSELKEVCPSKKCKNVNWQLNKLCSELKKLCEPEKGKNLNEWLNKLYSFRENYNIYKRELSK